MKLACRTVCALAVPALLLSLSPASAAPSVKVGGTVLRVTFDDGQIVSGRALAGATLTLRAAGRPGLVSLCL